MVVLRPSAARKATGWSLLALGVLGCVLPFLQGFLFLALGLFVLRDQHGWAARGWDKVARRWPGAVGKVEGLEGRMSDRFKGWKQRAGRLLGRR
ncbi:PGPGW domain-containing protein [Roseomonas gilardii]|uniref:PGPGW domain-containing protein n=1 Tax=Roseomonas gilardii TaxID=257708 RepID=A0A1L7AHR8_9PROT|nr:PGPGW domain-containing protein [Roseomonas gilardii]APT58305.1 hypothetical protein RGI145_15485 [Roseomonas gilardii]MDT8330843.1 PGPGW domain-containing protein [Roseomonas gilardii]PZR11583.1 MAG: hypothetical protein DI532_15500 [Azospirillum brasilense]